MNTSNENRDPTQPDDLSDRLVDVALAELLGGAAPPDLSAQIVAATSRQPAAIARAPRTHSKRAFWASLAVAAALLIGVTFALLPPIRSGREASTKTEF